MKSTGLEARTGVKASTTTLSRLLKRLPVRLGRLKPKDIEDLMSEVRHYLQFEVLVQPGLAGCGEKLER